MSQSRNSEYIIRSNGMVRKALTKRAAEAAARIAKRAKAGKAKNDPVGDLKRAKAAGGVAKPKPKPRAKPKTTTTPKTTGFSTKPQVTGTKSLKGTPTKKGISNTAKAAGAATAATVATVALNKNKGGSFDDAFRKARAKGEGTNFTHNGKKYTAVTKDDLKKKGYSSLAAYNKAGGAKKVDASKAAKKVVSEVNKNKKRKRPVINAVKRVLLGKDKKFGGDKGLIDFIRKPKKKADGGMMNSSKPRRSSSRRGVGAAKRGFGKALR